MAANSYVMNEQSSTPQGIASCSRSISTFLPLLAVLFCNAAFADAYSDLPDTDKAYVKRICSPIQYENDTSAYRNCVEQHSEALQRSNRTPVASLDFDEQLSVQQACQKQGAIGDYRQCVVVEAQSLEGILAANMDSLTDEEVYSARQRCSETQEGVRAYRLCVNSEVAYIKNPALARVESPAAVRDIENAQSIQPVAKAADSSAEPESIATVESVVITEASVVIPRSVAVAESVHRQ